MRKKPLFLATSFVLAHIAFVAPFVPTANILPAGLGALSMVSMTGSLILAARWPWVDRALGGPDKSYGLHRWLGFFALFGALGHWALASPVGKGVIPSLVESSEDLGLVAVLGLCVMTAAAMARAIPYHLWKASHMLMGPIFLLAVYHTFFVASPLVIGAAPWTLMAVASLLGLVAWGRTLWRKVSPSQLVTVRDVKRFEGGVDVTVAGRQALHDFRPGQFATLAHNQARGEAHPFTIAGGDLVSRRFVIRAAGDWTGDFVAKVQRGDTLRLGRATGRFLPRTGPNRPQQLWVSGGVGVTPFLAALEQLHADQGARITLIHCLRSPESCGALADLEAHAARLPQLDLVVLSEARGEMLSPERLGDLLRQMEAKGQLYLCGPEGLKTMVIGAWQTAGLKGAIHSERFDFRGAYGLTEMAEMGKSTANVVPRLVRRGLGKLNAPAGS